MLPVLAGCAAWSMPAGSPKQLPSPRMNPDCVVVEVAFVTLPADSTSVEDVWVQVDEQHLPTDVRRRLADNGLRTGLIGTQIPDTLRSLLDANRSTLELVTEGIAPHDNELFTRQKRLQIRAGNDRKIYVTGDLPDPLVVLLSDEGIVRAKQFEKPQGILNVRPQPLGDGRVQLEVTPEIEFGPTRQRWVGEQGSFLQLVDRERHVFESLQMTTVLSPGQTLLVTTTSESRGLGGQLFANNHPDGEQRSAVLLRLAQTQVDDLFSPESTLAPLASPPDPGSADE